MHRFGSVVVVAGILATSASGCGGAPPPDGFVAVASGDTYGEWELQAEFEDGAWTGCLRMDYDEDGPRCADPDDDLVTFQDWTGAVYGGVPEGARLELDGSVVPLIDDRFFVMIEGVEPTDLHLADP